MLSEGGQLRTWLNRDQPISLEPTSPLTPCCGSRSRKRRAWPFILFLLLVGGSFSKPQTGPNQPPFRDIIVWQATTDVSCANDRGDVDRSAAQFPKRFSKMRKGTEVVAVEAGGGLTKPILKLRTVKNETGYIYVDDFKRHFEVATTPKR